MFILQKRNILKLRFFDIVTDYCERTNVPGP